MMSVLWMVAFVVVIWSKIVAIQMVGDGEKFSNAETVRVYWDHLSTQEQTLPSVAIERSSGTTRGLTLTTDLYWIWQVASSPDV